MKVTFLTTSFPRFKGDYAGVFVFDLARALAARGTKITVIAPHTAGTARCEQIGGVDVVRFPYFFPRKLQALAYGAGIPTNLRVSWVARLQLAPFLMSFLLTSRKGISESDIVHAHWIEPGAVALPWVKTFKRPLVVSVHRFNPVGWLGKTLYEKTLQNADCVLFNSSYTRARCLQEISVKSESVIPPGIDTNRFWSKWSVKTPRSEGLSAKEPRIVFALGSLLPVKGFIYLIKAMPLVLEHIDCKFIIGGQGPEADRLSRVASELGVEKHLELLGRVSTEDVPELMRTADIFVLPSIPHDSGDNEALGMVLIEALASGTPCVASRTGGIPDVIDDRTTGLLAMPSDPLDLASKIVEILSQPNTLESMGRAGRRKVERKYSTDHVGNAVLNTYQQFL